MARYNGEGTLQLPFNKNIVLTFCVANSDNLRGTLHRKHHGEGTLQLPFNKNIVLTFCVANSDNLRGTLH
ncbi:hypothetical protein [Paracoccus sp. (in: a-proteobacteria)]|uniref:hypothetical protein n=1 Tax=Paracoccus sp. TaxID=267 RepID=UPI002AFE4083|nr:hypothetical protein [Paracoccus sp. (in: a-proteobacteria)]